MYLVSPSTSPFSIRWSWLTSPTAVRAPRAPRPAVKFPAAARSPIVRRAPAAPVRVPPAPPQWTHGGVVFAPKPRDYTQQVNRKVKRLALKSALSSKVADSELIVFDALNIEAPKTKEMVKALKAVNVDKALIVLADKDETVERAAANIPGVKTTLVGTLNTYEVLKYKKLILTKDSVAKIEEVYV